MVFESSKSYSLNIHFSFMAQERLVLKEGFELVVPKRCHNLTPQVADGFT